MCVWLCSTVSRNSGARARCPWVPWHSCVWGWGNLVCLPTCATKPTTYVNKNYSQILTSASTSYLQENFDYKNPNPDAYGKGFFVIQGASATASDSLSAAAFIDAYGNNATYDKEDVHYFLINIGASDMGLYRFKDDSGADNNVVADELTPVALFVGLRTEDFTTQDLFNVFI